MDTTAKKNESYMVYAKSNVSAKGDKKKCIRCGDPVFNNSRYCWECYKYEHFESK